MIYDIFFSICQTPVDGHTPSEKQMFLNFFDQVKKADQLGYDTAWVAETHLSCQVQKQNPGAVIPEFQGEIGLNTDILQLAQKVFNQTKNINVGSAIRNILCNGGPIAHAEAIKTFLTLHNLDEAESRKLKVGFAAGRFPFSNVPYGVHPRNKTEEAAWPVLKSLIFKEATEIFLRLLNNEVLSDKDITIKILSEKDFREPEQWDKVVSAYMGEAGLKDQPKSIEIASFWKFPKVGVIPFESSSKNLELVIGSHDPKAQQLANTIRPCGVFNLSITPSKIIDTTHDNMKKWFHKDGGSWQRSFMPRTALVFVNDDAGLSEEEKNFKAKDQARKAYENYWKAMQGTLDPLKVDGAVENTIFGNPAEVAKKILEKYHSQDRLMLWFDFNNHDNEALKKAMEVFKTKVVPLIEKEITNG